jgi:hypothetical protein
MQDIIDDFFDDCVTSVITDCRQGGSISGISKSGKYSYLEGLRHQHEVTIQTALASVSSSLQGVKVEMQVNSFLSDCVRQALQIIIGAPVQIVTRTSHESERSSEVSEVSATPSLEVLTQPRTAAQIAPLSGINQPDNSAAEFGQLLQLLEQDVQKPESDVDLANTAEQSGTLQRKERQIEPGQQLDDCKQREVMIGSRLQPDDLQQKQRQIENEQYQEQASAFRRHLQAMIASVRSETESLGCSKVNKSIPIEVEGQHNQLSNHFPLPWDHGSQLVSRAQTPTDHDEISDDKKFAQLEERDKKIAQLEERVFGLHEPSERESRRPTTCDAPAARWPTSAEPIALGQLHDAPRNELARRSSLLKGDALIKDGAAYSTDRCADGVAYSTDRCVEVDKPSSAPPSSVVGLNKSKRNAQLPALKPWKVPGGRWGPPPSKEKKEKRRSGNVQHTEKRRGASGPPADYLAQHVAERPAVVAARQRRLAPHVMGAYTESFGQDSGPKKISNRIRGVQEEWVRRAAALNDRSQQPYGAQQPYAVAYSDVAAGRLYEAAYGKGAHADYLPPQVQVYQHQMYEGQENTFNPRSHFGGIDYVMPHHGSEQTENRGRQAPVRNGLLPATIWNGALPPTPSVVVLPALR